MTDDEKEGFAKALGDAFVQYDPSTLKQRLDALEARLDALDVVQRVQPLPEAPSLKFRPGCSCTVQVGFHAEGCPLAGKQVWGGDVGPLAREGIATFKRASACTCNGVGSREEIDACPMHGLARRAERLAHDVHAAELRGSEVDKDVGIAGQHRARLKARIMGNVAPGVMTFILGSGRVGAVTYEDVADGSSVLADAILARCGL